MVRAEGDPVLAAVSPDARRAPLSHGGLRQKAFNVYEESLRVPLIFQPAAYPGRPDV
jgi:hypothetical protein